MRVRLQVWVLDCFNGVPCSFEKFLKCKESLIDIIEVFISGLGSFALDMLEFLYVFASICGIDVSWLTVQSANRQLEILQICEASL